jgi:phosphoglycerol transferase MdoB-like AlkP superfamily enzyme
MIPVPKISLTHRLRKTRYVDETFQKFLLIGLVVLEAGLAAGLAWMMYRHMNRIIEENLYRVHLAEAAPMMNQLVHEALFLLGIFFVVNLLALVAVDFIWRRYIYSILRQFMQLMGKSYRLDFTTDPKISDRHLILDLAGFHREQDRVRLAAIRDRLSLLEPAMLAANEPSAIHEMHDALKALDALLPKAHRQ